MPQPTPQYGHVVSTRRTIGPAPPSAGGRRSDTWPRTGRTRCRPTPTCGPSPKTPTFMACPRPSIEMAPICWTSSQAVVQRPHRMHASRSSTKNDLDASVSNRWSGCPARLRETVARRGGADLAEAVPLVAVGQSIERVRSRTAARTRAALGMRGAHDHALAGGQMAGGRRAAHALDVDETRPAGAERRAVRILAELRQRDAEAVDRIQHGGAGVELDRADRRRPASWRAHYQGQARSRQSRFGRA